MQISAPPGTVDILPEEIRRDRFAESVFMDKCRLFGYNEIHTPVFEYSRLFRRGVGHVTDIIEKELYTFSDKHGEKLALRPEGTTSVARAVLQHGLYNNLPSRFCYKITCYRQEDPEEGRLREFHQIGAECYGSALPQADCEVISLAYQSLKAMGAENLLLNINSLGCGECRVSYINALTRYLLPFANSGALCPTCLSRLGKNPLRVLDCKEQRCKAVAAGAPAPIDFLCPDCAAHYAELKRQLTAIGIPFVEKPKLIRGLDYYNGTVFEFKAGKGGRNGTVCGGGRYDGLCSRIGSEKSIPAVGFAIGVERAVLAMAESSSAKTAQQKPDAYVISDDTALAAAAAACLRNEGVCTERDLLGLPAEGQEKSAKAAGARWSVYASEASLRLHCHATGESIALKSGAWKQAADIILK